MHRRNSKLLKAQHLVHMNGTTGNTLNILLCIIILNKEEKITTFKNHTYTNWRQRDEMNFFSVIPKISNPETPFLVGWYF